MMRFLILKWLTDLEKGMKAARSDGKLEGTRQRKDDAPPSKVACEQPHGPHRDEAYSGLKRREQEDVLRDDLQGERGQVLCLRRG